MNENSSPTNDVSQPQGNRLVLLLFVGGAVGFAFWIYNEKKRSEEQMAKVIGENTELQKTIANLNETIGEINSAKLYKLEEEALAMDSVVSTDVIGKSAREKVRNLSSAIQSWQQRTNDLLDGDAGRMIASDPQLINQYQIIQKQPDDLGTLSEKLSARIENLMQPIEQARELGNVTFKPSDQLIATIHDVEMQAGAALDRLTMITAETNVLIRQAERSGNASDKTLREAIRASEESLAEEALKAEEQLLAKVRRENAQRIADAKADAEERIAEAKVQATKLAGEQSANEIVEQARILQAKREAEARRQQLEKEFNAALPKIRSVLSPMFGDGRTYRNSGKGPVSLSSIQASGALNAGFNSSAAMSRLFEPFVNDRVTGNARAMNRDFLDEAQELLIKYGELLVEKGMLDE